MFVPGSELARGFYGEVVRPLLDAALDGAPHSAGLLGWGSDVQGFDTERSTDHAWGPRLTVFLADEDHGRYDALLDAVLYRELPAEYRGYPTRFAFPHGTEPRHWVHILPARRRFTEKLNADPTGGLPVSEWLLVPTQLLRELTGGGVFHDGAGLLAEYRSALAWYPDQVCATTSAARSRCSARTASPMRCWRRSPSRHCSCFRGSARSTST